MSYKLWNCGLRLVLFAGEPVQPTRPGMQALLDASLVSWLGHLKAAAEARA